MKERSSLPAGPSPRRPRPRPCGGAVRQALSVLLLSTVSAAPGTFFNATTDVRIGFQIHSCNSLAQWPALLRKGARSFKVDPRWLRRKEQQRPDEDKNQKRPGDDFLLSHDPPLPPWDWEGRGYSDTLGDLLDLLTDPQGPFLATALADPPLRIALCFKGAPPGGVCGGGVQAQQWLEAVDSFFAAAQERVAASGLQQPGQVEFLLDGNAIPVGCLAQRWRPWASVWMNGSAPDAAFAADAPVSEGLDRFRVLNEAASEERWAYYAQPSVHFGKFGLPSSPYPYQAFEPAAQATIQSLVRVVAGGPPHAPGLDFATNTDVAMLQVYAGVGLNQELPPPLTHATGRGEAPEGLVAILRPGLALVLEQGSTGGVLHAYAFDADEPLSSLRGQGLARGGEGLSLPGWRREEHGVIRTMSAVPPSSLWLSTEAGRFLVYRVHEDGRHGNESHAPPPLLRLELERVGSLVDAAAGPVAVEARQRRLRRLRMRGAERKRRRRRRRRSLSTAVLGAEGGALTVLELFVPGQQDGDEEQGCRLAHQVLSLPMGEKLDEGAAYPILLRASSCLWSRLELEGREEENEEEEEEEPAVAEAAVAVPIPMESGGEHGEGLLVFAAAGGGVHARLVSLTNSNSSITPNCWVQIGVGDHVSAGAATPSRARPGEEPNPVVMLLAGGGFCYNSHLHNTGPADVCKLRPKPTRGVLDYTYGFAGEWVALLRGACTEEEGGESSAHVRLISACDARLLHGSYDLGTRPSLALYPLLRGQGVGMLGVHTGFERDCPTLEESVWPPLISPSAEDRGACLCGPALPRPGRLVADSFPLRL